MIQSREDTPNQIISHYIISNHIKSKLIISNKDTSYHIISRLIILNHMISISNKDTSYHIISRLIILNHMISYHIKTDHIESYDISSYQVTTNPALLCQLYNLHCQQDPPRLLYQEVVSQLPNDLH